MHIHFKVGSYIRNRTNYSTQIRQQLLHYHIRNRTKSTVFEGDVGAFEQHIFVGVWKPLAVGGPHVVNAAGIVAAEEWARRAFYHVVAFLIHAQVLRYKRTFALSESFADALNIRGLEAWRVAFTASSAA